MRVPFAIKALADILKNTQPARPLIRFGELSLNARRQDISRLMYNQSPSELLHGSHDYTANVGGAEISFSGQLYLNTANHYRLFAYSRSGLAAGMLFSLNFTTQESARGLIALSQRLRFSEGRKKEISQANSIRKAKARVLADILSRSGIPVTDNLEVYAPAAVM